jgi:preprotein translocase subunit SecG
MYTVLFVIHIMVTLALIAIILVQRSASDGMGLSGGSSTGLISGRTAANLLTRTTAVLAALFILCSLGLGILTARSHNSRESLIDKLESKAAATAPAAPSAKTTMPEQKPAQPPVKKSNPSVPRPE